MSISHVIKGGVKGGDISKNFLDLNISILITIIVLL